MGMPVVLITGALTGIGRATALAYAAAGARIAISGRNDAAGTDLTMALRALGVEADYVRADVRHENEVSALVDRTVARFGRLDIAVNSAGTEGKPGPLVEQTGESYNAVFDTNVRGTFLSMKHELRVMLAQRQGCIVNLSSTVGHKAAAGLSIYTASKHAVEGLTKAAALEAAPFGVRVNAVSPGPIETEMLNRVTGTPERKSKLIAGVPLGRSGTPEEVAQAILFLTSGNAEFIAGHILCVDGGKSAL
jgi:NAD(P)-dependent dehydrogenase (short-subunit alcohol dehydrogenase family)